MQNELLENTQTQGAQSVTNAIETSQNAQDDTQNELENQAAQTPATENTTASNDTQTASAQSCQSGKKKKSNRNLVLASCVKFIFIGDEQLNFRDLHGKTYNLEKGDEIIVPKGSMEVHMNARKTLFKRV